MAGVLLSSAGAAELSYYLPKGVKYDPAIPKPKDALGWGVGEWHVRHDQLVAYLKRVSAASDRMQIKVIGHTHEQRELLLLTVSSPANLARLEKIRKEHLKLSLPGSKPQPADEQPLVLYMGYNVHGDESSAGNSALLVAYHLAAAQGPEIDRLLANSVILLDPCLNPDGLNRFAQWANSHRGKNPVGDVNHREHHAVWPAGRGNHYWFDLNRDWLLLQHPESRARIKVFHEWRPNVHTDFHEMGGHSTYFFQPGVPERKNPLTPLENVRLTEVIAGYHAKALDAIGSLYYTEERFDDYYYGKGSTYPDIHGALGILFEQASSRGHLRESPHGEFNFAFTIRNQFRIPVHLCRRIGEPRAVNIRFYERHCRGKAYSVTFSVDPMIPSAPGSCWMCCSGIGSRCMDWTSRSRRGDKASRLATPTWFRWRNRSIVSPGPCSNGRPIFRTTSSTTFPPGLFPWRWEFRTPR